MKDCVDRVARLIVDVDLADLARRVVDQSVAIQQIPAPTFAEADRAHYVAQQFAALGLLDIDTDDRFNVYGTFPGAHPERPGLLVIAHTDTIFAAETDLTVRRDGEQIYGPGLGDNSIGVAALLGLVHALRQANLTPESTLYIVATTREEGLGDLGGIRAAYARLAPRINGVVNLEGLAFGHVYHGGISVRRLHITATTPGGHSWLHFGRTSATHVILDLGARLASLRVPQSPRTTYNVGMVNGGQAINAIATHADLWFDMRSEEKSALDALERQARALIANTNAPELTLEVEVVGDRPGGRIAPDHPLVLGALAALGHVGIRGTLETGSTDANIPLAEGCPAVTIGITRGGNAHRLDEYIETEPVAAGMQQLLLLVLGAAACESR